MTFYTWQADNLLTATQTLHSRWQGDFTQTSSRIITDTRVLQPGDIFLAIKGDNFDGHDYLGTALDKGAVAAIVSQPMAKKIPQLVVDDTKLALGQLGAYRRTQKPALKVVAITGSSGKTTCKEMLGSILAQVAPTLITRGNLNNDLGVPMMLLELTEEQQFAVLELGANHIGEIAYTTQLVKPDVACTLNIGTAHLGEFGSRANICQAKSEIFQSLDDTKTAVVPAYDDFSEAIYEAASRYTSHIIRFGSETVSAEHITVTADATKFTLHLTYPDASFHSADVQLNFIGEHNVSNALAAAACASALGISLADIVTGLTTAMPAKGRLTTLAFGRHRLIDDTYNANPHAVRAAAKVLKNQGGKTMLVLGDIGELGDAAEAEHQKLGHDIATVGVDVLYTFGELTALTAAAAQPYPAIEAQSFADKQALADAIKIKLENSDTPWTVLFKGSRYMKMESLIEDLLANQVA